MTSMNLLQALGHIDPKIIAEAAPDTPRKISTTRPWVKWVALAACLCLIIAVGAQAFSGLLDATSDLFTIVKPSKKPSSGLSVIAKLPTNRPFDADEAFEVQVGYGFMTGRYQYATLEINAPGFEITDAQGNVYTEHYSRMISDFASDRYLIRDYDSVDDECCFETFTFRYIGGSISVSGGISFWLTTLQHGEPSTPQEENAGPRGEVIAVYYEIKNGKIRLSSKRKQNQQSSGALLKPVLPYNAVFYDTATDWINEDFASSHVVRKVGSANDEYPKTRTFIVDSQQEYEQIFNAQAEVLNVNFDTQMLVVYTFSTVYHRNKEITDLHTANGVLTVTYEMEKDKPDVTDASMPYQRWFVVKLDKLEVDTAVFEETE